MNSPTIELILSDIDGTILDEQHRIDQKLPQTIQQLKKQEIPFILASARSPRGIFPLAEELQLGDTPIACYNGALILEGNATNYQTITEHALQSNDVVLILDVIKRNFPQVSISLYSGIEWFVDRTDKWTDIEAAITKDSPTVQDLQLFLLENNQPIHKLLLIEESAIIQELHKFLQKLSLNDTSFYLSKDNYLEVTSKEVSKEKALIDIANYYQIPLAKTMTLGDNFNDIPMLKLAGIGIVMQNAPQEVKNSADIETLSNNDYGVSHAIHKYVLAKKNEQQRYT